MKPNVLVISAGIVHPNLIARHSFKKILDESNEFSYTFSSKVEDLTLLNKRNFSSVILYFHRQEISENSLDILDNFVLQGGGLFAVHSASASFKKHSKYFEILGGRFVSHGKIIPFNVYPEESSGEIFPDLKTFSVFDELYIHEYQGDVTVRCATDINGVKEPVVWTKEHGKGKICYCSLGHQAKVMEIPEVKEIIKGCINWIQPESQ